MFSAGKYLLLSRHSAKGYSWNRLIRMLSSIDTASRTPVAAPDVELRIVARRHAAHDPPQPLMDEQHRRITAQPHDGWRLPFLGDFAEQRFDAACELEG